MPRRISARLHALCFTPPGVAVPAPRVRKAGVKKASAPGALERQTQQATVAWLERVLPAGSVVQCVRNERQPASDDPMARARFHTARKKDGYNWGFPDLLCCLPAGRGVFIEMKRPGVGELSDRQDGMHTHLRSLGWIVFVSDGIESARHGLRTAGIPLRESAHEPARPAKFRVKKAGLVTGDAVPW